MQSLLSLALLLTFKLYNWPKVPMHVQCYGILLPQHSYVQGVMYTIGL